MTRLDAMLPPGETLVRRNRPGTVSGAPWGKGRRI